jgi:DNA polymerase I-like protein with 3'-5' exonuclease and polymerase domains
MNIYHYVPPQQPPNGYVGIDIEIFGMNDKTLHRPTSGKFACLSIAISPEDVYMIHDINEIPRAMYAVKDSIWAIHNAKFDLMNLRRWDKIEPRKKLWDTLLIERILYGGYFNTFGLNDLARRYLNVYMEKETRDEFKTATEMNEQMIYYAALDASMALSICYAQQKGMTKNDFKIWNEVDRDALWAVMDMKGMAIDVDKWLALAELNKQRGEELKASLPINPHSYKKLKLYLIERGFKGLKNTQEDTLIKAMHKYPKTDAAKYVQTILDSRDYLHSSSTYGRNFVEHHVEYDNDVAVIIPDWNITGAETGRMSCSDPNLQNIPVKATKEFRECFIARPGHIIIVWDYSSQEPRICAEITQDKRLLEILHSKNDIYCEMAWDVYEKRIQKSDPLRDATKPVFLGLNYGESSYGLAKTLGIEVDEAERLQNKFLKKYKGVAKLIEDAKHEKKYVKTILGRRAWLNPYSNQCERNAINSRIQGSAGDMTKQALAMMHKEWNFDCPFSVTGIIHDEIVADVPKEYVNDIAKFGQQCMVEVAQKMCPSVPAEAKIYMGSSWACKE